MECPAKEITGFLTGQLGWRAWRSQKWYWSSSAGLDHRRLIPNEYSVLLKQHADPICFSSCRLNCSFFCSFGQLRYRRGPVLTVLAGQPSFTATRDYTAVRQQKTQGCEQLSRWNQSDDQHTVLHRVWRYYETFCSVVEVQSSKVYRIYLLLPGPMSRFCDFSAPLAGESSRTGSSYKLWIWTTDCSPKKPTGWTLPCSRGGVLVVYRGRGNIITSISEHYL